MTDPARTADDVRPDKVVEDGPVDCYRKGYGDGYEAGYEAGKQAATTGMWAKGYQAGWGQFRERLSKQVAVWANEPIPTQSDDGSAVPQEGPAPPPAGCTPVGGTYFGEGWLPDALNDGTVCDG